MYLLFKNTVLRITFGRKSEKVTGAEKLTKQEVFKELICLLSFYLAKVK
jgi:hypothetical protein